VGKSTRTAPVATGNSLNINYPSPKLMSLELLDAIRNVPESYPRPTRTRGTLVTGSTEQRPSPAYFAFEFYPCHPKCKVAADRGLEIWKSYEAVSEELASLYRDYALRLNKARIISSAESYSDMMVQFHYWLYGESE
jgi:hypothetical protein